jgi:hypothetical protein
VLPVVAVVDMELKALGDPARADRVVVEVVATETVIMLMQTPEAVEVVACTGVKHQVEMVRRG